MSTKRKLLALTLIIFQIISFSPALTIDFAKSQAITTVTPNVVKTSGGDEINITGNGFVGSGYLTRYEITSSSAGNLSDQFVRMELDTESLITANQMASDCSDIRFYHDVNRSESIGFNVLSGCNTANTKIDLFLPNMPGGTSDIFMSHSGTTPHSPESDPTIYQGRTLEGLEGLWHFDEDFGTDGFDGCGEVTFRHLTQNSGNDITTMEADACDSSGHGRHLIIAKGNTSSTSIGDYEISDEPNITVPGKFGNAIRFSGTNQYFLFTKNIDLSNNQLSIGGWFKRDATDPYDQDGALVSSGVFGTNSTHAWHLVLNSTTTGFLRFYRTSTTNYTNLAIPLALRSTSGQNIWNHFAAIQNGGNTSNLINGGTLINTPLTTYEANKTNLPVQTSNDPLRATLIGKTQNNTYFLNGDLDELFIFSREHSKETMARIYTNYLTNAPGMVGHAIIINNNVTFEAKESITSGPKVGFPDEEILSEYISSNELKVITPEITDNYGYKEVRIKQGAQIISLTDGIFFEPVPIVENTSPENLTVGGIRTITINGNMFENGTENAEVKISRSGSSDILCQNYTTNTLNQITCDFDLTGVTTYGLWDITVRNPSYNYENTKIEGVNIQTGLVPTITSINPKPSSVGSTITISGENFIQPLKVFWNNNELNPANFSFVNSQTITVTVPAGNGEVNVFVQNPDFVTSEATPATFIYSIPISVINPNAGNALGGTSVTFTGSDFTGVTEVTFNGVPATSINVISDTSLSVITPAGPTGDPLVEVVMSKENGQRNTQTINYRYLDFPTVDKYEYELIGNVRHFKIFGTNFKEPGVNPIATNIPIVRFNGSSLSTSQCTGVTFIQNTVEPGGEDIITCSNNSTVIINNIQVINVDHATTTLRSGINIPNFVQSISPTQIKANTGTTVNFSGTNLINIGAIIFNAITLDQTSSPISIPATATIGLYDLLLDFSDNKPDIILKNIFKIFEPKQPEIISITPNNGPTIGQNSVIINGNNFDAEHTQGSQILFNSINATNITFINENTITATVPLSPLVSNGAGLVNVTVINAGDLSDTLFNGYEYQNDEYGFIEMHIKKIHSTGAGNLSVGYADGATNTLQNGDWQIYGPALSSGFTGNNKIYRYSFEDNTAIHQIIDMIDFYDMSDATNYTVPLTAAYGSLLNMPFSTIIGQKDIFNFKGNPDGYMLFGNASLSNTTTATGNAMTSTTANNMASDDILVAPAWNDHISSTCSGTVKFKTMGQSPNRVFIVEYRDMAAANAVNCDPENISTFQVHVYENKKVSNPVFLSITGNTMGTANDTEVQRLIIEGSQFDKNIVNAYFKNQSDQSLIACKASQRSETRLTCNLDIGTATIGDYDMYLTNNPLKSVLVENAYSITASGNPETKPKIINIIPNRGKNNGGESILIQGSNFHDDPSLTVLFGGTPATIITRVSKNEILATSPSGSGVVDITVSVNSESDTLEEAYTYYDSSPTITGISQNFDSNEGGAKVVLTGTNFERNDIVKEIVLKHEGNRNLYNQTVKITIDTLTLINDGKMKNDCSDIRIFDSNKTTELPYYFFDHTCYTEETEIFTKIPSFEIIYFPNPTKKRIYLSYGNSERKDKRDLETVSFFMENFDNGTIDNDKFEMGWTTGGNGTPWETQKYHSIGKFGLASPAITGTNWESYFSTKRNSNTLPLLNDEFFEMNLIWKNHGHSNNQLAYCIGDNEQIIPTCVYTNGINSIQGGIDMPFTRHKRIIDDLSGSLIVKFAIKSISGTITDESKGYMDELSFIKLNKYVSIESISPETSFGGTNNIQITTNGTEGTNIEYINDTQISFKVGAKPVVTDSETGNIVLTNPDLGTAMLEGAFTYYAPPQISSVSPQTIPTNQTTTVTISGLRFFPDYTVKLEKIGTTIECENYQNISDSSITCNLNSTGFPLGKYDLTVERKTGIKDTLQEAITISSTDILSIDQIIPIKGPLAGGNEIKLIGQNFSGKGKYERVLSIENPHKYELENQPIFAKLNTEELIDNQKMQNNCDDLRVFDQNRNTTDFWIDGCNSKNTLIWVKPSLVPIEGLKYHIEYGDETLSNASNLEAIFPRMASENITYWFSANSVQNTEYNEGVEMLIDKSGKNNNLSQATENLRPIYVDNRINGLPAISFNGTNQFLIRNTINQKPLYSEEGVQLFSVIHYKNDSGIGIGHGDTSGGIGLMTHTNGFLSVNRTSISGYSTTKNVINKGFNLHSAVLHTQNSSNQDLLQQFLNGVTLFNDITTYSSSLNIGNTIYISRYSTLTRYSEMDFAEGLLVRNSVNNETKKEIENYLNIKYNLYGEQKATALMGEEKGDESVLRMIASNIKTITNFLINETKNEITFTALENAQEETFDISYKTSDGREILIENAYTYGDLIPIITSFSPFILNKNQIQTLSILGENFQTAPEPAKISLKRNGFSEITCTEITFLSDSRIDCAIDLTGITFSESQSFWDLSIENEYFSTSTTQSNAIFIDRHTNITSIDPNFARENRETSIVINGENFDLNPTVYFGIINSSNQCQILTRINENTITCRTPSLQKGIYDVIVRYPDTSEYRFDNMFRFVSNPTISSISPSDIAPNIDNNITITGSAFENGVKVYLGNTELETVNFINSTAINAFIPQNTFPTGRYEIKIINPDDGFATNSNFAIAKNDMKLTRYWFIDDTITKEFYPSAEFSTVLKPKEKNKIKLTIYSTRTSPNYTDSRTQSNIDITLEKTNGPDDLEIEKIDCATNIPNPNLKTDNNGYICFSLFTNNINGEYTIQTRNLTDGTNSEDHKYRFSYLKLDKNGSPIENGIKDDSELVESWGGKITLSSDGHLFIAYNYSNIYQSIDKRPIYLQKYDQNLNPLWPAPGIKIFDQADHFQLTGETLTPWEFHMFPDDNGGIDFLGVFDGYNGINNRKILTQHIDQNGQMLLTNMTTDPMPINLSTPTLARNSYFFRFIKISDGVYLINNRTQGAILFNARSRTVYPNWPVSFAGIIPNMNGLKGMVAKNGIIHITHVNNYDIILKSYDLNGLELIDELKDERIKLEETVDTEGNPTEIPEGFNVDFYSGISDENTGMYLGVQGGNANDKCIIINHLPNFSSSTNQWNLKIHCETDLMEKNGLYEKPKIHNMRIIDDNEGGLYYGFMASDYSENSSEYKRNYIFMGRIKNNNGQGEILWEKTIEAGEEGISQNDLTLHKKNNGDIYAFWNGKDAFWTNDNIIQYTAFDKNGEKPINWDLSEFKSIERSNDQKTINTQFNSKFFDMPNNYTDLPDSLVAQYFINDDNDDLYIVYYTIGTHKGFNTKTSTSAMIGKINSSGELINTKQIDEDLETIDIKQLNNQKPKSISNIKSASTTFSTYWLNGENSLMGKSFEKDNTGILTYLNKNFEVFLTSTGTEIINTGEYKIKNHIITSRTNSGTKYGIFLAIGENENENTQILRLFTNGLPNQTIYEGAKSIINESLQTNEYLNGSNIFWIQNNNLYGMIVGSTGILVPSINGVNITNGTTEQYGNPKSTYNNTNNSLYVGIERADINKILLLKLDNNNLSIVNNNGVTAFSTGNLNEDGGQSQSLLDFKTDYAGNILVLYRENNSGNIYIQKLSPSLSRIFGDTGLRISDGTNDKEAKLIVDDLNDNSNFAVVYTSYTDENENNSSIKAKFYKETGEKLWNDLIISNNEANIIYKNPQVEIDMIRPSPGFGFHVVYEKWLNNLSESDIYSQKVVNGIKQYRETDGLKIAGNQKRHYNTSIAKGGDSEIFISWQQENSPSDIFGQLESPMPHNINSTFVSNKTLVINDGLDEAFLTVTLRNESNEALSERQVQINIINGDTNDINITPTNTGVCSNNDFSAGTTDSEGEACFILTSTASGQRTLSASDITDPLEYITVHQTVTFLLTSGLEAPTLDSLTTPASEEIGVHWSEPPETTDLRGYIIRYGKTTNTECMENLSIIDNSYCSQTTELDLENDLNNDLNWILSGLDNDEEYRVVVFAVYLNGTSQASNSLTTTPINNDWDNDGIPNEIDNCPTVYNPGQEKTINHSFSYITDQFVNYQGSFNSTDDKIAYSYSAEAQGVHTIYIMNKDGSNKTKLNDDGSFPQFTVDESKIIYTIRNEDNKGIYIMNIDGSDQRLVYSPSEENSDVENIVINPNGEQIAFSHYTYTESKVIITADIYTVNIDGTQINKLTNSTETQKYRFPTYDSTGDYIYFNGPNGISRVSSGGGFITQLGTFGIDSVSVSSDNQKLYFSQNIGGSYKISVINTDGTGLQTLTNDSNYHERNAKISPDGKKIIYLKYDRNDQTLGYMGLWIMNSDGSNQRALTGYYATNGASWSNDSESILVNVSGRIAKIDLNDFGNACNCSTDGYCFAQLYCSEEGTPDIDCGATLPEAPTVITENSNQTVKVDWLAPSNDGGSPITMYTLIYGISSNCTPSMAQSALTNGNKNSSCPNFFTYDTIISTHNATSLNNGIQYSFYIAARNSIGDGPFGSQNGTPATVPNQPTVEVIEGIEEANVTWTQPANGGSPITGYRLAYGESLNCTQSEAISVLNSGIPSAQCPYYQTLDHLTLTFTATGLTGEVEYSFYVSAENSIGIGNPGNDNATPYEGVPAEPPNAPTWESGSVPTDFSFLVTWNEPSEPNGTIEEYKIRWGSKESNNCSESLVAIFDSTNCITATVPGTQRSFQAGNNINEIIYFAVWAKNNHGLWSPATDVIKLRANLATGPEGRIEIHLKEGDTYPIGTSPAGELNYLSGISNGQNDALNHEDFNFMGTPTRNSFRAAEGYNFTNGIPSRMSTPFRLDNATNNVTNEIITDGFVRIPMGFTTDIYGRFVNNMAITSAGTVYLYYYANPWPIEEIYPAPYNANITDMTELNNSNMSMQSLECVNCPILVAGKWQNYDLSSGGNIYWEQTTQAGVPMFIAHFESLAINQGNGETSTFQIKIFESPIDGSAPPAPILSANAGNSAATTFWQQNSDGGQQITKFMIRYGQKDLCPENELIDEFNTNTNCLISDNIDFSLRQKTLTDLVNDTEYHFVIFAYNALGTSPPSNVVSATPLSTNCGVGLPGEICGSVEITCPDGPLSGPSITVNESLIFENLLFGIASPNTPIKENNEFIIQISDDRGYNSDASGECGPGFTIVMQPVNGEYFVSQSGLHDNVIEVGGSGTNNLRLKPISWINESEYGGLIEIVNGDPEQGMLPANIMGGFDETTAFSYQSGTNDYIPITILSVIESFLGEIKITFRENDIMVGVSENTPIDKYSKEIMITLSHN